MSYFEKKYETIEISDLPDNTIDRSDYYSVRINLGWTHNFSPYKTFSMSDGPAYLNYVDQDDYWTQYFDIGYTSQFKNGSWFVRASGGFDDRAFNEIGRAHV